MIVKKKKIKDLTYKTQFLKIDILNLQILIDNSIIFDFIKSGVS